MAETYGISFLLKLQDFLSAPLANVGAAFDKLDKKFGDVSKTATGMGKKMTTFATLPIMGWAGYAAHEAGKLDIAFREMRQALEELPAGQMKGLENDLRDMSTVMPRSAEEFAEYAKMAGKMNELGDVRGFAKFMAGFTIANEDMRENTETFMDMARAIGLTQPEYEHMGAVITGLAKRFHTSASGIVRNALDIGGSLEAPKEQLMVLAAYMDTFGAAAQPIRRLLDEMQQAAIGKNMLNLEIMSQAAGFGTNLEGFQKEFKESPAIVLQKLLKGFGELKGKDLYVLRSIFDQVGLSGQKVIGVVNKMIQSQPELGRALQLVADKKKLDIEYTKEIEERTKDFNNQAKMLWQTFNLFGAQFGQDIAPVMKFLVDITKNLLKTFIELPAPVRYTIEGILGLVAAVGPLLIAFGTLKGLLAVIGVKTSIATVGGLLKLTGVFGALAAAIIAVNEAWQQWEKHKATIMGEDSPTTVIKEAGKWFVHSLGQDANYLLGTRFNWFNPESGAGGVMTNRGQATVRVELDKGLRAKDIKSKGLDTEINSESMMGMTLAY